MSAIDFPPIETVLGVIDDQKKLPLKGKVGEAWFEENVGRLWVWDGELLEWRDLNLWKGRGFASSVANLIGFGESAQAKGAIGAVGERGLMGAVGPQGERGLPGPAGKDGKNGVDGKAGLAGAAGKDGKNGVDGKAGLAGAAGKDGKNGVDGKAGLAGPAGKDGKNGVDGKAGLAGPAGKDGKNGVDGKAGLAGPAGKDGKNGVAGKAGAAGLAGPKGDRGPAGSDLRTGARDITALLELPEGTRVDNAVLRRVGDTVELSLAGLRSKKRLDAMLGKVPAGFRPSRQQSLCTSDLNFEQVRVSVDADAKAAISASQAKQASGLVSTSTSLVWLTDDEWPSKLPGKEWRYKGA